jgi:hypothetical protein
VLHWFTPQGVAQLAGQFGMDEVDCGRPSKKIAASHAKSLMRHKLGTTGVGRIMALPLNLIPDGLVLPYPAEDLFWMLLRKQ